MDKLQTRDSRAALPHPSSRAPKLGDAKPVGQVLEETSHVSRTDAASMLPGSSQHTDRPSSPVVASGSEEPLGKSSSPFSMKVPEASWPAAATTRRQASPEEWERLKPTIYQLYMQERKPFKDVAEVLRRDHNFYPTYVKKKKTSARLSGLTETGMRSNI